MAKKEDWPTFCSKAPDKFFNKSANFLKTLNPPADCALTGLSKEIWDKFEKNKQSSLEFSNKINLWKRLNKYIKTKLPEYGLFMAGSTLNGFGLKSSDVDLSFLTKVSQIHEKELSITHLSILLKCLKNYEHITGSQIIKASVPLINFHDKLYNLDVDINFNATANIRNTHLLYRYSQVDWRVRPLVIVIKLWAKHSNIIGAKYGSLSSYPLILMVINFLQCGVKPAVLPCLQRLFENKFEPHNSIQHIEFFEDLKIPLTALYPCNHQSLGDLLIGFFRYYDSFEFDKYVISVRKGTRVLRSDYVQEMSHGANSLQSTLPNYMYIEEPFNLSNVGRTVYKSDNFEKIKHVFSVSYQSLKKFDKLDVIFE